MKLTKHLRLIFVYLIIALIFTWPLALNLSRAVPSIEPLYPQYKNMGDEYAGIWSVWQFKKAIQDKENFFFVKYIFYPLGADSSIADHNLAPSLLALPFIALTDNLIIVYNAIIILSFVLSAYSMYLLADYLLRNKYAAFLSGVIFSFSSAKIAHALAAHIAIISLQWLPLFILFFLKIFKEKERPLNYFLAGLFFLFVTLTSYYLVIMLVIFIIFWLLLNLKLARKNMGRLLKFGIFLFLMHLPITAVLINAIRQGYFPKGQGNFEMAYYYGADLLGFFVPGFFHSFLKDKVRVFYEHLSGNAWEHTTYIGYAVLCLFLFSLYKLRKNREVRTLSIMSSIFFVLSLGAVLWVGGKPLRIADKLIFFPQYLFRFLPIFNNIRLPSRFYLMMMLFISLICGYGLKFIMEKYQRKGRPVLFIFLSLVVLENLSLPLPLNKLYVPLAYREIAKEKEDFSIIDIPFWLGSSVKIRGFCWTTPQFYQAIHHKNILGGNLGRIPDFIYDYYPRLPVIGTILKLEEEKPVSEKEEQFDRENLEALVNFLDLKYVVIPKEFIGSPVHRYLDGVLAGLFEKQYYPDGYLAYRLRAPLSKDLNFIDFTKEISCLYAVRGFTYPPDENNGILAQKQAALVVPIEEKDDYLIRLNFFSLGQERVKIKFNNKVFYLDLDKGQNHKEISVERNYIKDRINKIDFISGHDYAWGIRSLEILKKGYKRQGI